MKLNTQKKGFAFSPFFLIVLMLLGLVMVYHFTMVDTAKARDISEEGAITKAALQAEGDESALRNAILFASYDAIDIALNRPDLLTPSDDVESKEGLRDFLQRKIKTSLESMRLYVIKSVKIEYATGRDYWGNPQTRSDGFMVYVEGMRTDGAGEIKAEKFVDSGVFYYLDKLKSAKKDFANEVGYELSCKIPGVGCYSYDGSSITCYKYEGEEDGRMVDDFYIPPDDIKDADWMMERLKESLVEIAKAEAGRKTIVYHSSGDIVTGFSVDYIETHVQVSTSEVLGGCCFFVCTGKGNYCRDERNGEDGRRWHDKDYQVYVSISGKMHVKELYRIADATLKDLGDRFEVCVKSQTMNHEGKLKPLQYRFKEYDLPFSMAFYYIDDCKPAIMTVDEKRQASFDPPLPGYYLNEDSIKFDPETKCEWKPDPSFARKCSGLRLADKPRCECDGGCHQAVGCYDAGGESYGNACFVDDGNGGWYYDSGND